MTIIISIRARSFTRRVLETEAPKIRTAHALHRQNKNKPFCCGVTKVIYSLSLSTCLLDTCAMHVKNIFFFAQYYFLSFSKRDLKRGFNIEEARIQAFHAKKPLKFQSLFCASKVIGLKFPLFKDGKSNPLKIHAL